MSSESTPLARKVPRRYGFSCNNCRRKKIHCHGEKPICRNCNGKLKPTCSYGQSKSTELQLDRAYQQVQNLQEQLDAAISQQTINSSEKRSKSLPSGPTTVRNGAESSTLEPEGHEELFWSQVSIDDQGTPNYHGSTSRFHAEVAQSETEKLVDPQDHLPERTKNRESQVFYSNAELLKVVWEPLAYTKLDQDSRFSPKTASMLMKIYWTWQHPLHNWVYRPCFFRDMALGGPYFSEFLLMSIFALAARHVDETNNEYHNLARGEKFLGFAKSLLLAELSQPKPKIPTIQGLLILGGRQCAMGNSSEGWLYTAESVEAIQMMKDIGLHLNPQKLRRLEKLDAADLEARQRLFLGAYLWDKSISICLGRPPTLTDMPQSINDISDQHDDLEPWNPVSFANAHQYPQTQCYNTTTFKEFCRLGEVVSRIYSSIYNKSRDLRSIQDLKDLENELYRWFDNLPPVLKVEDATVGHCPPPHIFTLNILYHTLLILIYRPCLQSRNTPQLQQYAESVCSSRSVIIGDLFLLYGRTFNYKFMTYLTSYCIYTAATINVYDIKQPRSSSVVPNAAARLSISLQVLEHEALQTPGIHRSIDIIKAQLRTWNGPFRAIPFSKPNSNSGTHDLGNGSVVQSPPSQNNMLDTLQSNNFATNMNNSISSQHEQPTSVLDGDIFDGILMGAGGGFQPNAFHWTLDDTWDLDLQFPT